MTKTITRKASAAAAPRVAPLFSGKGSAARATAMLQVAPLSFAEDVSRAASLANARVVLGKAPTEDQRKAFRLEWVIGRVASRLPVTECLKGRTSPEERLDHARDLVCHYARAAEPGKAARPLRKGQKGRRSAMQQRIVRAAEEAVSVFMGELGEGKASTNSQRKSVAKANRNPAPASGMGKAAGKASESAKPSHSELVKPAAPVSSDDYVNYVQSALATLCAYDNKHARKRPTTHGAFAEALLALRQLANKAANDYQVRKAAAEAKAKETK